MISFFAGLRHSPSCSGRTFAAVPGWPKVIPEMRFPRTLSLRTLSLRTWSSRTSDRHSGGAFHPAGLLKTLATPGLHERNISALFQARMAFRGSAPAFDRPLMIIAFSNRSGSHLVCDYALQTGRIAGAGEHLNHEEVAQQIVGRQIASFPDYIRHLDTTLAQSGKVLALKASWDQLAMLLRQGIPQMFSDTLVLHVMRNDTLAQAVSYAIALRTGRWRSRQVGSSPDFPDTPLPEIERQTDEFNRANLLIRCLCTAMACGTGISAMKGSVRTRALVWHLRCAQRAWQSLAGCRARLRSDVRRGR